MARVLVADDHQEMSQLLADHLVDLGHEVTMASDGLGAIAVAERELPDLVITDLRMPRSDGMDVLDALQRLDPSVPVIVMTAFGGVDTAVEAMRRGAFHYLTKPFRLREVQLLVERALSDRRLKDENASLRRLAEARVGPGSLVGSSPEIQAVLARLERAARVAVPVLVRGESGTGKELVARAIHQASPRHAGPFVAVNCTALPASLLESELFGHGKGAFTGATTARRGLFLEADGGTLFLDEIGDMPLELQSRLLRVLEDGMIRPVGADKPRKVDVRIVAATHQPLDERVREGRFRQDLFYRLDVVPIRLPALRDRLGDLPQLVARFLAEARQSWPDSPVKRLTPDAMAVLARRLWPGNVRELRNLVQRLAVLADAQEVGAELLAMVEADGLLPASALPPASPSASPSALPSVLPSVHAEDERLPPPPPPPLDPDAPPGMRGAALAGWSLRQVEDHYIGLVMERCGGNKTQAARILEVDPSTLYRWERGRSRTSEAPGRLPGQAAEPGAVGKASPKPS